MKRPQHITITSRAVAQHAPDRTALSTVVPHLQLVDRQAGHRRAAPAELGSVALVLIASDEAGLGLGLG